MSYVSFLERILLCSKRCCTLLPTLAPEQWVSDGILELRTAFSRDQVQKIYVQDLIVEDANSLWKLLQVTKLTVAVRSILYIVQLKLLAIHGCVTQCFVLEQSFH